MKQSKFQELVAGMLNELLDEHSQQMRNPQNVREVYYAAGYLNSVYDVAALFGADLNAGDPGQDRRR